MSYDPTNPLIVQGDRSVLVEVDNPKYAEARDALAPFAELEKSPEHIHTYRLTPLSLWNAAAAGLTAADMIEVLRQLQQVPAAGQPRRRHRRDSSAAMAGSSSNKARRTQLRLVCADRAAAGGTGPPAEGHASTWASALDADSFLIDPAHRGVLKQALIAVGYPAEDLAGYTEGAALPIDLRDVTRAGPAVPRSAIISARRPTSSTPAATCAAAAASSCCPAAPARPSSASPPWP